MASAVAEITWLVGLFQELKVPITFPISFFSDNDSAIQLANNPVAMILFHWMEASRSFSIGIFRETLVWAFEFEVSRTCYPRREISVIWIEEGDLTLSGLWTFLSVIWIVDFSIGYLDRREISVIWIVDFSIVPLSVVPGKPAKDPFFLEPPKPNFSEAMASCPKEDIPNFKELLQEENFYLTTEEGGQGLLPVLVLSVKESDKKKRPTIVFLHSMHKCKSG
ncbi:hypothetical protein FXO38_28795 [Capsicum annuum]|nr:hypothetical protein FXO38_28795 [Capsicum annuum]